MPGGPVSSLFLLPSSGRQGGSSSSWWGLLACCGQHRVGGSVIHSDVLSMDTPIAKVPHLIMMPHVMADLNLPIIASGNFKEGPGMIRAWFKLQLPGVKSNGNPNVINLYSKTKLTIEAAIESAAKAVNEYARDVWKAKIHDVNFKAYSKLKKSYDASRFWKEMFQDKATVVAKAFTTAKKNQKATNYQLKKICDSFSDVLPLHLTVATAGPGKPNKLKLAFTGNSSMPTLLDQLALALIKITEDNEEWTPVDPE